MHLGQVVRPLVSAGAVAILCFGATEVLERTLWVGLGPGRVHLIHVASGMSCSLLVAAVVAWIIVNRSPGFHSLAATGVEQNPELALNEGERDRLCTQWFIALRWVIVLLAPLLIYFSVRLAGWLPNEVWWPLIGLAAALAASNLVYMAVLRNGQFVRGTLIAQGYVDLVILAALLHFSGGIENPCSMLMIFHVMIAGMLLSRNQCYWMAIGASLIFALLAWVEWADVVEHYTLQLFPHVQQASGELFHPAHHSLYVLSRVLLQALLMVLTAYFVSTLAERLHENERKLHKMADRAVAGQQLLEQAMETAGAGLRVLDRELHLFWCNARWQSWGVCPGGRPCPAFAVLNGENAPARHSLGDGAVRVTEVIMDPGKRGCACATAGDSCPRRTLQVTTAPLRDSNGNILRIVEMAQDISHQKQAQAQLIRAGQLAAVGELAGRVAHEVNNPIAIISAKARLLLSDHGEEMSSKVGRELAKMTDCADRVARIAQGLLSYCRPSPSARVQLDLRIPVRRSLAIVEQHAQRSGVMIRDELADELAPVQANTAEMEQVFLNLFLNALDAMPSGGQLRVQAERNPSSLASGRACVAIVVEDSGVGIPAAIRDRVFEPFFTTKVEGRGTGLGLSICMGVVRAHDGEIKVDSVEGQGTRFTIMLPVDCSNGSGKN